MKKEIASFYNDKNLPVSEILKRGRLKGLNDPQMFQAMENIYYRVLGGEQIKNINIVKIVWEEAKQVQGRQYAYVEEILEAQENEITKLKNYITYLVIFGSIGFITIYFISMLYWDWVRYF